jgi:hypothetical protein
VTDLRRAEFAVAAFGLTAFLLALIFVLDAMRFHGDVLIDALEGLPRGEVDTRGMLLVALALFDLFALVRAVGSIWRGVSAHRRIASRMPMLAERDVAGRRVVVVAGARPLAFCAGLVRPRVFVSEGALECLSEDELAAVVEHEAHHAARRDPLRLLVARAIGGAYSLGALARHEQALAELAADDAAVRSRGARPLASALLAFHGDSAQIAPERVDRLTGVPRNEEIPHALVAGTAVVIAGLFGLLVFGLLLPGHPRVCLPLASAPIWWLFAITARLVAMGPAWLGWRRAGAFLT